MDLKERFQEYIALQSLFTVNDHLIIAVSGGVDSVVLCHLCKQAGYSFTIAHCNFKLRGAESERDEAFVKHLAEELRVPVLVNHFDTINYAKQNKLSIQVAARQLRYDWFEAVAMQKEVTNASAENNQPTKQSIHTTVKANKTTVHKTYIATAHHQDDNIETVLMNLFKGTGIAGLHGIHSKKGKLVRPLLFANREEIEAFAKVKNLSWVEDSSNAEKKYTRNYFRHELIPSIEKVFPTAKENIAHSIQRLNEAELLYNVAVANHKKKLVEYRDSEIWIPVLKLLRIKPLKTVVYEIIKDYGFSSSQVTEVIKLLSSDSGKYIISTSHRLLRNRAWLIISSLTEAKDKLQVIEEGTSEIVFTQGRLQIESLPADPKNISKDAFVAWLDASAIQYPLLLRKWKEGDYFYPLGMTKKKKLARFFIDQKLSQLQKEKVWVVESNKRILWVVGYRIDDRFKMQLSSKKVLKITLYPNA